MVSVDFQQNKKIFIKFKWNREIPQTFFSLLEKQKNFKREKWKNIHRMKWAIFQLKSAWYVYRCVCCAVLVFWPIDYGAITQENMWKNASLHGLLSLCAEWKSFVIWFIGTIWAHWFVVFIVKRMVHASLLSTAALSPKHIVHTQRERERNVGTHSTTNMQTLYNLIFLKLHTSRGRFSMCVAVRFFFIFAVKSSDFFSV